MRIGLSVLVWYSPTINRSGFVVRSRAIQEKRNLNEGVHLYHLVFVRYYLSTEITLKTNLIWGRTYLYPAAEYPPPLFLPTSSPLLTCQMLLRSKIRIPFEVSTTQRVFPYHIIPPA